MQYQEYQTLKRRVRLGCARGVFKQALSSGQRPSDFRTKRDSPSRHCAVLTYCAYHMLGGRRSGEAELLYSSGGSSEVGQLFLKG